MNLHLASFQFDVTPPLGHPLCGGWEAPAITMGDPLEAVGFVLLGAGKPIVICAVDWTGLLNEAHFAWRQALADAADTDPDRVAVHCVHQHDTPMVCLEAQRIVQGWPDVSPIADLGFFQECLDRAAGAVDRALKQTRPITGIGIGQAQVRQIASNRRIARDEHGQVTGHRRSFCNDSTLRALPEGLVDPWLKTVGFYDGPTKIAACHYYATHPQSHYGQGQISSDFVGLARRRRQQDEPDCRHLYFTGCAGNISAGKYNDGSVAMRPVLVDRLYQAIVQSEQDLRPVEIDRITWKTADLYPLPRDTLRIDSLENRITDPDVQIYYGGQAAFMLAWLRRLQDEKPITISALQINDAYLLHLPAECFVQYQLRAQQMRPDDFIAVAAYGDGGPWYVPVKEEYPYGGYEVSVAFCDPQIDDLLTASIRRTLGVQSGRQ